jgi:ATP-dependent DNA ligase
MDTAQLTLVRQPFDDPNFLFELKHDGFRALAHVWDGHCELISRRRNSYKSFQELRENLGKLKVKNAILRLDVWIHFRGGVVILTVGEQSPGSRIPWVRHAG